MTSRTVLITGATSGIGEATAHLLARHNYPLILCGRRQERLTELQQTLSAHTSVHTLCFDVAVKEQVQQAIESLTDQWKDISILINNAGNAHGLAPIQLGAVDDWDAMIDSNVKGLLYVTNAVMPSLLKQANPHIINIGSIAGKEVYPNGNVYCASKFAVDALTKGMRLDLNKQGVKVTAIHPGMVETEFSLVRFKGDTSRADTVYNGVEPLHAQDIAEVIHYVLSQPKHVVLSDITILPLDQASATVVNRK